jgi:2-polyprenyl-3-methyl-5-hydroxy-6-metoxy-1,4-benzoquinol methylase
MNKRHIDADEFIKKYIDEFSGTFSLESILSDMRKKQVLKAMEKYKHENILEIGCGLNPLYSHIDGYKKYTIVEPGKDFTKALKGQESHNISVINGFIEDIYEILPKNEFDFIFLSGVLHQAPQPSTILKALKHLCKEDTVVHINIPNASSFHRLLALEMGYIDTIFEKSESNVRLQANWVFDKDSLYKLVQENGFEVADFGTYFLKILTNKQIEKLIELDIVGKELIRGLERIVKYLPEMGCEMFVNLRIKRDECFRYSRNR